MVGLRHEGFLHHLVSTYEHGRLAAKADAEYVTIVLSKLWDFYEAEDLKQSTDRTNEQNSVSDMSSIFIHNINNRFLFFIIGKINQSPFLVLDQYIFFWRLRDVLSIL